MLEKELLLNDQYVDRYYVQQVAADGMLTPLAALQSGIIALGQIGTDEAGAALGQLQNQTDTRKRALITVMLERCPGERAAALLAKALDDPELLVRRNSYEALWHRETKLWSGLPEKWDADSEAKMREAVKAAAGGK
jgi:HEAT repeat protein